MPPLLGLGARRGRVRFQMLARVAWTADLNLGREFICETPQLARVSVPARLQVVEPLLEPGDACRDRD